MGTIEEQMRLVDKVVKECDAARKSLENVNRKLDDIHDEVKRYRDFLLYEKSRRDPTLFKTSGNTDRGPEKSVQNEQVCGTMQQLTAQLTQEWIDKLKTIHASIPAPPSPAVSGGGASSTNRGNT